MPDVLITHTVGAGNHDADAIRDAIAERLPDLAVDLTRTPARTRAAIADTEIAVTGSLSPALLDATERLRWVQAISSGVDSYPRDRLHEAGIHLTNAAGVHAEPIAEQVLGYMLAFERNIHRGISQQSRGAWERYTGGELTGKTLGLVGVGAIGGRVAEYGATFGMRVLGVKRDPSTAPDAVDDIYGPDELHEVLVETDYLVVACPLTEQTRGMIGAEEFATLPSDAVLINIARGPIVDEDALIAALQGRRIGGAGLDVFEAEPLPADSPLWDLSNVIVTPHMAGYSPHNPGRIAEVFVENYRAFDDGDPDAMPTLLD